MKQPFQDKEKGHFVQIHYFLKTTEVKVPLEEHAKVPLKNFLPMKM